jgi:hypothetical protein
MQIQIGSFVPDGLLEPTGLGCLVIVARHHGLHLTVSELIHDNMLTGPEVSVAELIKSASGAGLKAKAIHLTWYELNQLKELLPTIVRLEHGGFMVLLRLEGIGDAVRLVLQDPDAGDGALLLIDQEWFERLWTGEVVLVKRNYASNTIESSHSVPSDLRPGARNTSDGASTSLGNAPARGEARVNLGNSEPRVARSASALAKKAPKDIAQAIVAPPRRQIRARIGEAQATANTGSTGSAPATSVATFVGQERTLSRAASSSSTRQFIALTVGAATTVIVWVSILATQPPILPSIANLANSLKISNVDRREINKTNDRVEVNSDMTPKSKKTNFLPTNGNDAARALARQSNQGSASTEMPAAIELKPLQAPADSVNRTETESNLKTMADVQQPSNGDRISRPEYQPPVQRKTDKAYDRTEVDSDIGSKSKNTNFLSTNGNDATRALDRQSNQGNASTEMPPAIELKPPETSTDSANGTETVSNLKTTAGVQQLSNGDQISRPEYQPPIRPEINKTNDRVEVDPGPKSKNTNLLSTTGNDGPRAPARQSNQRRAPTQKPPAMESKSLRTPADSVNGSEARFNLRTTADVLQVQQRLVKLGYLPFLPDGVWGPHSILALRAFRTTAGLGGGDQWDRKTEDILFATTAPKAIAPTASPSQLPPG